MSVLLFEDVQLKSSALLRLRPDDDSSSSTRCIGRRAVETAQIQTMARGLRPVGGEKYGPQSRAGVLFAHPTSIPRRREWRCWCVRLASRVATSQDGTGAKGRAQR